MAWQFEITPEKHAGVNACVIASHLKEIHTEEKQTRTQILQRL